MKPDQCWSQLMYDCMKEQSNSKEKKYLIKTEILHFENGR